MRSSNRWLRWASVVALATALVVPTVAFGVPGSGTAGAGGRAAGAGAAAQQNAQRRAALQQRIATVLQLRKIRFDNAVARVSSRIDKVGALATQVEKAGGDVSSVRSSLDRARDLVSDAQAREAEAVAAFQGVPDAANKRAAFVAARVKARLAVQTLQTARLTLRNAILDLRAVANGLKGAQQ